MKTVISDVTLAQTVKRGGGGFNPTTSIYFRFYEGFLRFSQFFFRSCYLSVDAFFEVISDKPTLFNDPKRNLKDGNLFRIS